MEKMRVQYNVKDLLSSGRNRYAFKAEADAASIDIFGEIDDWWGFGVREMALNLSENKNRKLNINIHSPGGSVTEGIGIANLIKSHNAETTTTGIGFVASIASVILLAGDRVRMAENAFLMIHNPWSIAVGDSEELRQTADVLDKMENELAGLYAASMQSRGMAVTLDEVKALMAAETWYTADEAKAAGFIDEVVGKVDVAASEEEAAKQVETLAKYRNIPQALADNLNKFSNTKTGKMAKENKSLFAKLGEIFATAADEIAEPETKTEEPTEATTEETTDATMTIEEMMETLKREGYTVAKEELETKEPEPETETKTEELAEVMALKAQVEELTKAVKRTVGTPSGGADDQKPTQGNKMPSDAKKFFDNLATAIKTHRPN
jgi:ATP-dependent protease ClpP protease subunit